MRMNSYITLLFMLCLITGIAQELPERVTLVQAVTFGQENNRQILNASREVQRAYKERWSTIAIGLPQISASANYQNFLELPTSLIPAQFFGGNEGSSLRFNSELLRPWMEELPFNNCSLTVLI